MADLGHVSTGGPHAAAHNEERDAINTFNNGLRVKIDAPANPKIGSFLLYDGTKWNQSSTRLFEGSGQPEGLVAAPIGSRYVATQAGAGGVEWIKTKGLPTDNTGWTLLAGDTGWRNVSNMIAKRGTAIVYSAYLRRTNNVVDLYLDLETPHNDESPWTMLTLPPGFRPDFTRLGALQPNSGTANRGTAVNDQGDVSLFFPEKDTRDRFNGTWTTMALWPTNLPGTPA